MDAPTKKQENSFAYFHLTKDNKIGYNEISQEEYDKIRIIIIYLGDVVSDHPLFKFLNFIFKNDIKLIDRISKIKEEYGIQVNEKFKEEVSEMCNISDYFKQQGIEQGRLQFALEQLQKKMNKYNLTLKEAMESLDYDMNDYEFYKKELNVIA